MSWLEWDRERKANAQVRGVMTSKEGLEKLKAKRVELHTVRDRRDGSLAQTRVLHEGRTIGMVIHPHTVNNGTDKHSVRVYEKGMTQNGPADMMRSDGHRGSHDAAVEAILKAHDIKPPQVSSATRMAEFVNGPFNRSVLSGRHEGKREAPKKGMSETAKRADSIATTIRMNAARHDPHTGEKLTTDTRSADKLAARVSKPLSFDRIRKIYGNLLTVHRTKNGEQGVLDRHMSGLAMLPEEHHRLLSEHFKSGMNEYAGIRMSNGRAVDVPGSLAKIAHDRGDMISGDRPNERQGGSYWWKHRQLLLPENKHSGSADTAAHEAGHALDHALGLALSRGTVIKASSLPHFQQVYNEVTHRHDDSGVPMNPYYLGTIKGQNGSGATEMFAESYAAWAKGQRMFKTDRDRALYTGYELGVDPADRERVGRVLNRYHDVNDRKIKEMMSE